MILRILFALSLLASIASAANKYVTPGGSGSGASWSAPASPSAINSASPGDIVYLAGGNYGNGIPISASGSSSAALTIRKATSADHGSDSGWTAAMDAPATFSSGWFVTGKYVTIDGNEWKPPGLPTKFGISIRHASGAKGIDAGGSGGNLTVRDVDVMGPGINASKAEADGIHFPSNSLISGCAVHDTDVLLFAWKGNSGSTFEYCLLYNASSDIVNTGNPQSPHPDVMYSGNMLTNGIMRWCMVANVTAEGVFFDKELTADNMEFYGNVMFQGDCQTGNVPIEIEGSTGKVFVYHNTFVDFNKSNNLGPGITIAAGSAVKNNLWINCVTNFTHLDTNGFSAGATGANAITNPASPFVTSGPHVWVKGSGNPPATRVVTGAPVGYNPSGMDAAFRLVDNSWAKGHAITVPAGRNTDMYGNTGNDLGAIQSGTSPAPTPAPSATPSPSASPSATPSPVPTASPSPGQPKFVAGDYVTPSSPGLNVRSSPAGAVVGQHGPGDVGTIVSGPQSAPLNGTNVNWYLINWDSAPASGHSGDDDLIKTAGPSPSPSPDPSPSPTPVTYKNWTNKLNANQSDWIGKNPPYPDGE
jgi:hypothetical protein